MTQTSLTQDFQDFRTYIRTSSTQTLIHLKSTFGPECKAEQTKEFLDEGYEDEGTDEDLLSPSQNEEGPDTSVPSKVFYVDGIDDDPLCSEGGISTGPENNTTTTLDLQILIQQAIQNGSPTHLHGEANAMITEYHGIFAHEWALTSLPGYFL